MKKIIVYLAICCIAGCYVDNEEELYPATGNCDTTNISYAATVAPILQSNGCTGCHSGASPSGGISLNTYTAVKTVATNGKLYGTISHSAGFSPMPKNGNKMGACNINKIKAWITAGAANN